MKRRVLFLVIFCILLSTASMHIVHADSSTEGLYVLRPKVYLNSKKGSGHIKYISFGTELTLLAHERDYCKVQEPNGDIGYVATGYIGYVSNLLWLTNDDGSGGVVLSYWPNMRPSDFGYSAGGKRINELALVLYEQGDYYYVVTNEGCSGYIYKYDRNIISYKEYLKREKKENIEDYKGDG